MGTLFVIVNHFKKEPVAILGDYQEALDYGERNVDGPCQVLELPYFPAETCKPTTPCVRLVQVKRQKGNVNTARVQVAVRGSVEEFVVQDGDDLAYRTKDSAYAGYRIGEIRTGKGEEYLELCLPGPEWEWLRPGEKYELKAAIRNTPK